MYLDLSVFQEVFMKFEKDKCGYLNSYEMRDALASIGMNLLWFVFVQLYFVVGVNSYFLIPITNTRTLTYYSVITIIRVYS